MVAHGYGHAIVSTLKEFKGTAMNTSIAIFTIIIEEVLNRTVYYCPCVEPFELIDCPSSTDSFNSTAECTMRLNYWYGISYIFGPALALFLITAASSPRLWKTWTGCCNKTSSQVRREDKILWTLMEIAGRALVAPATWICFALLDGRYYACAFTPLPYTIGIGNKFATSCADVAKLASSVTYSDAYSDNRSLSQLYGWISISAVALLGFGLYAISRCVYPLTYYHAKYFGIYREFEESEFDDEMKAKAQKDAESYIRKFMAKDRDKALWDRISTVFSFHRNPKNMAMYSYLHEFILEEEREQPLLVIKDGTGAKEENETLVATDNV